MPWHNQTGGSSGGGPKGPQNPWGQNNNQDGGRKPWGGGRNEPPPPPDLDDLLRKAQQSLRQILPGGPRGSFVAVLLAAAVVLVLWLASGFYFIQPSEHGVVQTFGRYTKTEEIPGLKYRMPWPFQTVEIVNVTTERRIEVGFSNASLPGLRGRSAGLQDVPAESLMLTGDENIIDIDFVVLWRVGNARDFIFKIRDPEDTIKKVAESAMREVIGQTQIQPALTEARGEIQVRTRQLMQKLLDDYQSGVQINNVQLQKVDPPAPVVDAFNEVQRARQQKEQLRNKAEAYRNDILPRARGEAERLRQQADAYRQEIVKRAEGDAERFLSVYGAYSKARGVTTERIYLETMENLLSNTKTIVLDKSGQGVLPYLPLDTLRRQAPRKEPAPAPVQTETDAAVTPQQ